MAKSNGVCKYLDESTNLCTIYKKRPIFCRVDELYEKNLANKISREEFYLRNKEICKNFQATQRSETNGGKNFDGDFSHHL